MKFRSVLKKLKPKKKKSAFDGVVKDDDKKQSTFRGDSEELSPSKPSIVTKRNKSAGSIGSDKPQMVQRGPSDESSSSYGHLYRKQVHNTRIRSEVQQPKQQPKQVPVVQAPMKNKTPQSFNHSFQDDFGVAVPEEPNSTTWASFGNSSGFFHQTQSSGSLFTDYTAPESESSLSSPSNSRNSSFESTKSSQELISSEHSRSRRSIVNETTYKPSPQQAVSPAEPTQERRSDQSLPMPEALQVGTRDQRQRASPVLANKTTPSPVPSPTLNKSLYSLQNQESTPSPSPSPVSKRRSITDRYTAALNTSAAQSPAQSPTARKLFTTPSQKSVLDNHPMFRKRTMVEQEEMPISKPEERELPEAKLGNKTASSNSLVGLEQAKTEQEAPVVATIPSSPPTSDEPKVEDVAAAAAVISDQEDSVHAPSEEGSMEPTEPVQASPEQAEAIATKEEEAEEIENDQDQVESSQDQPLEATPQASQVEQLDQDEMPILSRVQSSIAANTTTQFSTVDTVNSSVAQSSKATTVSGDYESDTETAPIGELSFDSNSNHSHDAEEEETLDYTYDPDGVSLLSEDFTDYSQYTHELKRRKADRFSNWVENTIFGMANFMCPMEEGDVYDA